MKRLLRSIQNSILIDPLIIILPAITIVVRLIIFMAIPQIYEDAFISFRYAENLASGNGFVFNLGEKVLGTTTPLFTLLLAVMKFLGISCTIGSLIINMISEGITTLIIYLIAKNVAPQKYAFLPAILYCLSPSNISWSVSGMETAFYAMILAVAFYNLFRENYHLAVLFGAIACLIRIDGIGAMGIILLFIFFYRKKIDLKIMVLPAILLFSWELFSYFYFGSLIPNSLTAKFVLYSENSPGFMVNLGVILDKFVFKGRYLSSATSAIFLLGIVLALRRSRKYAPVIIWFFCYYAALVFSKTHIHGWYLIPPLFVYIAFIGIGAAFVFNKIEKSFKIGIPKLIVGLVIIIFSLLPLRSKIIQLAREYRYERNVRIPIGIFLRNFASPDASVYLEPIGIIGYYSRKYIYDDSGIVSPTLIAFGRYGNDTAARYRKILYSHTRLLILRNKYLDEFYSLTSLGRDFKRIYHIKYDFAGRDEGFTIFRSVLNDGK